MNSRRPSRTSLIGLVIFLLWLYVLLPGPIGMMIKAGYIHDEGIVYKSLYFLYLPITWCMENVEVVFDFYAWYHELLGLR